MAGKKRDINEEKQDAPVPMFVGSLRGQGRLTRYHRRQVPLMHLSQLKLELGKVLSRLHAEKRQRVKA